MTKRFLLLSSLLLPLLIFGTTATAVADASAHLQQAEALAKNGEHEQAEQIFQQIVIDYSGTEEAFQAQKSLTILYINTRKYNQAETAFEQLTVSFSGNKGIAEAVYYIGKHYNWKNKHDKATEIHQYNVVNFSNDMYAMWSQVEVIGFHLRKKDDAAAEAAVDKLTAVFSDQPTLSRELYNVAKKYEATRNYDKASQLYQYVIDRWPDNKDALFAQSGLAISHSNSGNQAAAGLAYEKVLTGLSQYALTAGEIYEMGKCFNRVNKHDKAAQIHQYNVEHFPNDKYAMWSQVEVAYHHIHSGDDVAADAASDKLLTVFSDQPALPRDIYNVAKKYDDAGRYDKAAELYRYVIDNRPADEDIYARMSVSMAYIGLGDDTSASAVLDSLIADFADHSDLPGVVFHVGEQYYDRAFRLQREGLEVQARDDFTKVIDFAERLIQQFPTSPLIAEAYQVLATCYRRLGQYEKAVEHYQKLADNWPDHEFAWLALFRVGRIYRNLEETGAIPRSEANPKARAAFELIVQRYPDSPAAGPASDWLNYNVEPE